MSVTRLPVLAWINPRWPSFIFNKDIFGGANKLCKGEQFDKAVQIYWSRSDNLLKMPAVFWIVGVNGHRHAPSLLTQRQRDGMAPGSKDWS